MITTTMRRVTTLAMAAGLAFGTVTVAAGTADAAPKPVRLVAEQGYVKYGQVSERQWQRMLDTGWVGDPTDGMEALYRHSKPRKAWGVCKAQKVRAHKLQCVRYRDAGKLRRMSAKVALEITDGRSKVAAVKIGQTSWVFAKDGRRYVS